MAAAVRSFLVVPQNVNAGWQATLQRPARCAPVRLDGWEQAWLLPAGSTGQVTLTYLPNASYRGRWPAAWPPWCCSGWPRSGPGGGVAARCRWAAGPDRGPFCPATVIRGVPGVSAALARPGRDGPGSGGWYGPC